MMRKIALWHGIWLLSFLAGGCIGDPSELNQDLDCGTSGAQRQVTCGTNGQRAQICRDFRWVNDGECIEDVVCVPGITQTNPNACGLNQKGTQTNACQSGEWVQETCEDPDECTNYETRDNWPCGAGKLGQQRAICVEGHWKADGACQEYAECTPDSAPETRTCGLTNSGEQQRSCKANGRWDDWSNCHGDVVCEPGDHDENHYSCGILDAGTQNGVCNDDGQWERDADAGCIERFECEAGDEKERVCGLNGRHKQYKECGSDNMWVDEWTTCPDNDECRDGDTRTDEQGQPVITACGIESAGTQIEVCDRGTWELSPCEEFHECAPGQSDEARCGNNKSGTQTRTCNTDTAPYTWSDWGECIGADQCTAGETTDAYSCGILGDGVQSAICLANGSWDPQGTCNEYHECVPNSQIETSCGVNGNGIRYKSCELHGDRYQWSADYSPCADPDECLASASEQRSCTIHGADGGYNDNATETYKCLKQAGAYVWAAQNNCTDPDQCKKDTIDETLSVCGDDGTGLGYLKCVLLGNGYDWGPSADTCYQTADALHTGGMSESFALFSVSQIASRWGWMVGNNSHSQLALTSGGTTNRNIPQPSLVPSIYYTDAPSRQHNLFSASATHACMIHEGDVYCWGDNSFGQLGYATAPHSSPLFYGIASATPKKINSPSGIQFTKVVTTNSISCALTTTQSVYCWGRNLSHIIADGSGSSLYYVNPQLQTDIQTIASDVALGAEHICIVANDDSGVWCKGNNRHYQVAKTGKGTVFTDWQKHTGLSSPQAGATLYFVYASGDYTVALSRYTTGTIPFQNINWHALGAGDNTHKQFGVVGGSETTGTIIHTGSYPATLTLLSTATAYPSETALCFKIGSTYKCAGSNADRMLADSTATHITTFSDLPEDLRQDAQEPEGSISNIALANGTLCARLSDGRIRCRGNNEKGQRGNGGKSTTSATYMLHR